MVDAMVGPTITSTLLVAAGAAFTASASLVYNNFKTCPHPSYIRCLSREIE